MGSGKRIISAGGHSIVCNAGAGETILQACSRSGVVISAPCGGRRRCGKCRVRLIEGQVSGDKPDNEGYVRSCTAVPLSDITISPIADLKGTDETFFAQTAPSAENRRSPLRAGIALDIGTTTVSARLVDLEARGALDTISELNDQRVFGADIMSRIGAAKNGKTTELFNLINRQTERIIASFQKRWGLAKIEKLTVSGNTVMLHLFLNVDPSSMGELPFKAVFLEERNLRGEELSLPAENVTILPSIAAFIGSDITAALAVLDILNSAGPSLLIDIGTNGEMALFNNGKLFCCSTAAGPAFEGAEISCGLGGVKGAISGVELSDSGEVSVTTIGGTAPLGICGSGLIDAVAVMLKLGVIDETGFMAGSGFSLAPGISITGRDIRQFQLAKSAIFSGIRILCNSAGLHTSDIKNTFIAGGLGFFINKQNAAATGIIPEEFLDRLLVCGNLSLQGAENCIFENLFLDKCKEIIERCSVIELAADPSFMDEFAENMLLNAVSS